MPSYTFSTLNDKDFEELVRDLLTKELNVKLQNFKSGTDKGIDLRFSTNSNRNHIVVQAKHYYRTGFTGLVSSLKKEKAKIKLLKPHKYFIVTSINLSPQNKDKIVLLLKPYLKSSNDIYGNEDLNRILQDYSDIEKKHFKLWLSSVVVLKRILNNSIEGRSEFLKEKIKRNINIYVQNSSLSQALKILKKHKFILITGQPGVGKTTLAYILIYYFLAKDYELTFVDKNITEAEDSINDLNSKQIFYFDDFLGANYFEILSPKSSESGIINFIERIQNSKNKYLVLTTRTTILNAAKQIYEKINQSDIESGRKELELKEYNDYDKAKILYNHLYFNNLQLPYRRLIFEDGNYWSIIKHENYNPRLIEYITDQRKFDKSNYGNYLDFVFGNLDNPDQLWQHSYENQIKDEDRFLLTTLFSLGGTINEEKLEKAFDLRVKYEVKNSGFQKPNNILNSSFRRLLDGFIIRSISFDKKFQISFINPSVNDFIISYLKKSKSERERIIKSAIFLEQIENIFLSVLKSLSAVEYIQEIDDLLSILSTKNFLLFYVNSSVDKKVFYDCKKMVVYTQIGQFESIQDKTDSLIVAILRVFDFSKLNYYQYFDLFKIIIFQRKQSGFVEKFILKNWDIIIASLVNCLIIDSDGEEFVRIFEEFGINYENYIRYNKIGKLIRKFVEELADKETYDLINNNLDDLKSQEDLDNLKERVEAKRNDIFALFNLRDNSYNQLIFFGNISDDLFIKNKKNKTKENNQIKPIQKTDQNFASRDIDDLFDINRISS